MAGNWSVVGYGDDPIPDDPGVVAAQVEHIKAVAADIAQQVSALPGDGSIDAVPWTSGTGAPEEFRQVVKKLPRDLDRLRTRYAKVGDAMASFQAVLANAKAQAQANLSKAAAAHDEVVAAQAGVAQMNDFAAQAQHQASVQSSSAPAGSTPVVPQPWTGPDYHGRLAAAQAAFNAAKAAVDQAVTQFHQASKTAASAVGAASNDDLKNDTSLWGSIVHDVGSVVHWVANHVPLQAISGILAKIAVVAGVLSFIPIVGEVAGAVALAAFAGSVVCDLITAGNDAYEGNFNGDDIRMLGFDALGVATFGAAKYLEGAAEVAGDGLKEANAASEEANAAAAEARANALSAQGEVDSAGDRVARLTSGNKLKVFGARVLGITGRAQSTLDTSAAALVEAQAKADAAAADATAKALTAANRAGAAKTAKAVSLGAKVADKTVSGGTGASVDYTDSGHTANPMTALVRATSVEVHHLGGWDDDPTGSAAQSLGAHLQAQPIPVSSAP